MVQSSHQYLNSIGTGHKFLIIDYLIIIIVLMAFDYLGLGLVLGPRFKKMAGEIGVTVEINYYVIIATYIVMLIGFFSFVDLQGSVSNAFLFGIVTHGIYELTNFATIKGWQPEFVILDVLWGGIIYSALFYFMREFY